MRDDRGRGGVPAFRPGQKELPTWARKSPGGKYFRRLLFFSVLIQPLNVPLGTRDVFGTGFNRSRGQLASCPGFG